MSRTLVVTSIALCLAALASGCGAAVDHRATLANLRDAIGAPITGPEVRERHNQLVEDVVRGGALDGLRQHEVQERIGRGEQCGTSRLCAERGFRPTDWTYDVGRDPSDPQLPAGPTLIVGFDSAGIVDGTYFVTRR